ncbi:DUF4957 domain-containing protein [Pedobacter sp. HMF7647]|uniref:DUF4957 domain-containing protein n=1 Tax=Hufsiella arboris TaxID=2695275 RepID=A0A7K1Y4J3_9SPHI|nr:DUF4957 domain-containing protein [Hufsiella arboris]MXV49495.1 DUF4957 domain-containing protein [Hufsiella arboris]
MAINRLTQISKMKLFKHNLKLITAALLSMIILQCCEKADQSTDGGPLRQFTPVGTVKATSSETSVKLEWQRALYTTGTVKYSVQISKDSLFNTVERRYLTDTTGVVITDDSIPSRTKYYARVQTKGTASDLDSKWLVSSAFTIQGVQIFLPVRDLEVKETAVTLRWKKTTGVNSVVFTPASGAATKVDLSEADNSAGMKVFSGLAAATTYKAEIFAGTKSKGILTFTTIAATTYSVILKPGDDIAAAISTASNNAVIGLMPGSYSLLAATPIVQKMITLKSTSGNPSDTKVNFKELTLKGNGAGVNLSGIEFDGAAPASSSYFINLVGNASDAEAATFSSVTVDNCIIHNTLNCMIRANRGALGGHKIDFVKISNTVVYDNGGSYDFFTFDKLAFNRLEITKSTFYNIGRAFINCTSTLTGISPVILIDQCTFNNFGSDTKYPILDAKANPVTFTMQNSIVGNVAKSGATTQTAAINATAATITFANNNLFNFTTGGAGTGAALTLPATAIGNSTVNMGWVAATNDFTLPAGSLLRTSSKTGGAIGDPRWAY